MQRLKFSGLVNGRKITSGIRNSPRQNIHLPIMTAENADENSGFKADEGMKCVSQPNVELSYFPTPVTKPNLFRLKDNSLIKYVRIINSICSDRLPWQLAGIKRDVRGSCTIFGRTAFNWYFVSFGPYNGKNPAVRRSRNPQHLREK